MVTHHVHQPTCSVEIGLGIAIGLAVLFAIFNTAFPHTAMLGRVPGSTVYRNVKQYPNAQVRDRS